MEFSFFGGLTIEEIAEVLRVPGATVERDWALARAWLYDDRGGLTARREPRPVPAAGRSCSTPPLALPEDERDAFLRTDLRRRPGAPGRSRRLLRPARAGDFISRPPSPPRARGRNDTAESWVRSARRPYRVVREIGQGGMGAVYLAERADGQYQQRVALKVIKRGMDTDPGARPLPSRAADPRLARPSHIARLLDGGTHRRGPAVLRHGIRRGRAHRPLRASAPELAVEDRLELFLQVCDAVQYAHQNLVVHRDLKPSTSW